MKPFQTVFLLLLTVLLISCGKEDNVNPQLTSSDNLELRTPAVHCETAVLDLVNGNFDAGTATLTRNNNGVNMTFKTDELLAGHAYTVWWVIWNNPEECDGPCDVPDLFNPAVEAELLYAAGNVTGANGKGNFGAGLSENDNTGTVNELFGLPSYGGLHDAMTAEIHLVLRSHGPAIPGEVNEQINTYLGGCDPNAGLGFPPFSEIPDAVGECGDIFAAPFPADCGD